MTATPQPGSDSRPPTGAANAATISSPSVHPGDAALETPPPHLLWATLESAYADPQQCPSAPDGERVGAYLALPIAIGMSLVLWVIIVELVLMR